LTPVAPGLKDIHLLHWSRQGELWLTAGRSRLLRQRGGVWEDMLNGKNPAQKPVEAIAETSDGTLWVALGDELYAWQGGRLIRNRGYEAYAGQYISALYGDRQGELWLGTDHGLLRLHGGRLTALTEAQGLPAERIRQILEDDHGTFWLGTLREYYHVARAELEAAADGRAARVAVVSFGTGEGLTGQTPLYNCQPNAGRGRDDRLWFCTQDGVLGIDADSAPLQLPPPPVYIDRVRIDGQDAAPAGLRLSTGRRRLAFSLSSPSFASPEKVRLRYRLSGFDPGWSETEAGQDAIYAGLPAGRYVLEVAASDPNGIFHDGIGAELPFAVTPLWWETWWARLLALAALTGGTAWLARFTSHRLLKRRLARIEQEHALEKERARIARDLHDELGGSLTRIALRADRLRRRSEKSEFGPALSQLARQARRLTGELESIIWTVNPRNNSLDRFASFVRQFALRFFHESEIRCTVRGAGGIPACALAPEVQHHLLTATKEALTNVLKHSRAGAVTIELGFASGCFTTRIADNGVGFPVGAAEHSERNGLANIAARLREIGGTLSLRSSADRGTEISWSVPVAGAPPPAPL
jgi:signal transduction histidine kinase